MTALFKNIVMNGIIVIARIFPYATWNPLKEGRKEGTTLRDFIIIVN